MSSIFHSANSSTPKPFLMRMGCTKVTITYRIGGNEGICLAAPQHGVQQIAGFDVSKGDLLGLDDILEHTLAHANLSDVASYITSSTSSVGTTLYFDSTGHGLVGTPFAVLQGVSTNVAQLVADGGMKYIPDSITMMTEFNTPFSFRPDGLETVVLAPSAPGIAAEQVNGFDPSKSDVLNLSQVLNRTTANPDFSNLGNYLTATVSGGNTILSLDSTGAGGAGTAFAVLTGETVTVAQLLADHALTFDPHAASLGAGAQMAFIYRPEGNENAVVLNITSRSGPAELQGFSLSGGDSIDLRNVLSMGNVQTDIAHIASYVSSTQSGGNTTLWFDKTGSGHGGMAFAVLQNTSETVPDLLAHGGLTLT